MEDKDKANRIIDAYEKGKKDRESDRKHGWIGTELTGVYNKPPDDPEEKEAYYRGKKDG